MNNNTLYQLEENAKNVRYQLMKKGTELDFARKNVSKNNIDELEKLKKEVDDLRTELENITSEIRNLKFRYYVIYEIHFVNGWTKEIEKETYKQFIWLNEDLKINLPQKNNWQLDSPEISKLLRELIDILKYQYDEVTLLHIKRI
ncbi:hypothetical protein [Aureispira sp. CCB-QB1]|uniref:hypothetical protein n=1 Tax=Aureispira sp. CCB-QB1 TaxID=1313421 RepID=UPI000696B545|nr:hypothetical protein [Aureispira sp. CCB-QB1]